MEKRPPRTRFHSATLNSRLEICMSMRVSNATYGCMMYSTGQIEVERLPSQTTRKADRALTKIAIKQQSIANTAR